MKEEDYIEKKLKEAWNSPFPAVPEEDVQKSWKEVLRQIEQPTKQRRNQDLLSFLSIAATIVLLVGGYFFIETQNPTITSENFTSVDKEVRLSDGSLVLLKSGSLLTYKKYFTKERLVNLEGEAFFRVVKDSLREFAVITGASTIRVLGTSFLVKDKKNHDTEVALYTGRVSVSIKGIAESWGLIPGERLIYSNGEAQIQNFDVQMSFESGNPHIDIESMKMEELIPFLQERFGYKFAENSYDPSKRVTLRINKNDSLKQILELLSIINNRTYEINEETKEIVPVKK